MLHITNFFFFSFIKGELFKQQMLTVNIMLRCLNNLLDLKDEESLECLCKLLTTVGKELETKKVDLGIIFDSLKDIADKKYGRISSRVRLVFVIINSRNCFNFKLELCKMVLYHSPSFT